MSELIRQVRSDSAVRERYTRHFGMRESQLIAYLSGMQLSRLTSGGTYRVYSVPPDGSIKMHYEQFRAGTPVFADFAGTPLMIVKCGNPLTPGAGAPLATNEDNAQIVDQPATEKMAGVPDLDLTMSEDLLTLTPGTPAPPGEEIITVDQSPVAIIPVAGAFFNPWGLGLLGFLFIDNDSDSHITPVPEPATLAVLALGSLGLLRLRKRARR